MVAAPWPEKAPGIQESASPTAHWVTPTQRETPRQSLTTVEKSVACCCRLALLAGSVMRSSSSVTATSRPRLANRCMFACMSDGIWPRMKWLSKPMPLSGTPCASSDCARLNIALLLAFMPSML